ncbi:helix-turn-helix domain-containing protein [Clostridium merdae]|uniref:helix-turn-helix domain-containing protein n=1 Tax=Clostridium merdae TaxID=1958780 RepID=UPI000A271C46|nr:helix-turn-helix transcriptional regulator [Clostridium merdae]
MYYLERLRELRENADKGQKEIAEFLGITQQQYSLYETGTRHIKVEHLVALAEYYKVTTDYILGISNKKRPCS